jgi:hypothetical protein
VSVNLQKAEKDNEASAVVYYESMKRNLIQNLYMSVGVTKGKMRKKKKGKGFSCLHIVLA